MKGFIKKDFLLIKSNIKFLGILLIIFGFMAFNGETDISFILPFMSVVIMMSTFSYDSYNKWDAYVISLPNGRKNSIQAKYISTIILLFLITVVVVILTMITIYNKMSRLNLEDIFQMFLALFSTTIIVLSIMYPVIYKFGLEKARIGIFVGTFGLGFLISVISKLIDFNPLFQYFNILRNYWVFILPIVAIIILFGSYKISEKVYQNKEF